jgi:hypothetical protein
MVGIPWFQEAELLVVDLIEQDSPLKLQPYAAKSGSELMRV